MQAPEHTVVLRECRAVQIPEGTPALLSPGTRVRITQSLGGTYTVATDRGYLLRIDSRDADAIGKSPHDLLGEVAGSPLDEQVWALLKTCYDPEIPINIVDLGLVYNCEVLERPEGGRRVDVKMTLTAPGCGMGPVLAQDVKDKLERLPGIDAADVEIVFDPQWNQNMMSEAARLELGLF
ncbi:MAG TPA: putative Fe-S cluster assembly protein SufT [Thermoanaerobaculia bacterium]|nr:putative Fe-S cluster assembly protein SufT [Thermoanaerobaculia bacterium]